MAEYEVEGVTSARVAKKSKKVIWEYNVKWKGYSSDDNTWEPVASFSGSEDLITKFWARIDLGGRDPSNLTQFDVGETFLPVGPPRLGRKPTRKSTKPVAAAPTPPASAGASNEGTRSSKRRRSSPPPEDLEEKPTKRTRGRVSETPTRPVEEPRATRQTQTPRRPPAKATTTASSTRSFRRTKKRTPSPDIVPASEEEEEEQDVAMLVDPAEQSFADEPPSQKEIVDLSLEDDDAPNHPPVDSMQDRASSPPLPSHRARAANPRVKMVDDFSPLEGAIAAKARVPPHNGTGHESPVAGPSTGTRRSPRKPGPGRSSSGFLGSKNTSSLLTFEKGVLKTVKGKFTAPAAEEDTAERGSGAFDGADVPMVPPTSDELLQLGGFDAKAAEALDDFEDDTSAPADVPESASPIAIQQSLAAAKNNLFPPGSSMSSSFSHTVASVWRRATIFGPLSVPLLFVRDTILNVMFPRGLGTDVTPGSRSESKPFFLKLDATVSLPLDLTAVSESLDALICDKPNGPSGKFFQNVNARKLLDTVRTGGASAKVSLRESASEEQRAHFARFRSRLDQGELFTAMVDAVFLAFSSSETPLMQRLNLPPTLIAYPDSVFVTQLDIENLSAYVAVAETADTSRW
ncbi:hypothetical protein DFH07DRAFT_53206 [Mycena maculata]|uniref:Chromo domain-containing protein n=1 Tax=Mycena maculata TaxID=230809 RepID=A0AAD7IGN0_9AGAR|nr:hypothetical protein DFH07DRAFT_53206 [Mycena maculata]